MNKKLLFITLLTLGSLNAVEKSVTVEVPCYAKNSAGECTTWGGIVQGCKGPCSINYTVGKTTATCNAGEGPCNAVMPVTALLPFPITLQAVGTTHVKIPCITQDANGSCIRWGSINQGCKALPGSTCKTNLSFGDKYAQCKAESEASCNSNIQIKLP